MTDDPIDYAGAALQIARRPDRQVRTPLRTIPPGLFTDRECNAIGQRMAQVHRAACLALGENGWRQLRRAVEADAALCAELSDELAPLLAPEMRVLPDNLDWRAERLTFLAFRPLNIGKTLRSSKALRALLLDVHGSLDAGGTGFRSGNVATVADHRGSRTHYPPLAPGLDALDAARAVALKAFPRKRALAATVLMVALLNAHPFADGNGRTSRILYNLMMAGGEADPGYMPLKALALLSKGGHIVKLRRAVHHGDWLPLIRQMGAYYRVMQAAGAQD